MVRGRTIVIAIIGALLVVILALVLRMLNAAGVFQSVRPVAFGTCKVFTNVAGAEDMQWDRRSKTLYASASDRWARIAGKASSRDGIYAMTPSRGGGFAKLAGSADDFHPHGMSLYRGPDGALTLMAINRPLPDHPASVEIFDVDESGAAPVLRHRKTVTGGLLQSPNDLVAVGPDRFYLTNDHGSATKLGAKLETYLMLPRANVIYFDGSVLRVAAAGLVFANGINVSPDMRWLYVGQTTAGNVVVFARSNDGALTRTGEMRVGTGVDNIDIDGDGDLWIAGAPKLLAFSAASADRAKQSPSAVWQVSARGGVLQRAKTVYADLGSEASGGTVAVHAQGHLYIGTVFRPRILDCTRPG
jgi:arylesterase/paraoxonase